MIENDGKSIRWGSWFTAGSTARPDTGCLVQRIPRTLGSDYWLDQANEGAWFIESKRRICDDDDWLESDANKSAAGLVRLEGGNALRTWQNGALLELMA